MQVLLACMCVFDQFTRSCQTTLHIYILFKSSNVYKSMIYIDDCNIGWQIAGIMYSHTLK